MTKARIAFRLNGVACDAEPRAGVSLLDHVRDKGLHGAKLGCQSGDCGACTMVVNEVAVQACQMALSSVDGVEVVTVEGLVGDPIGAQVVQALIDAGAAQCGYCLPGIVAAASAAFAQAGKDTDIPAALAGNLCRCGTQHRILSALNKVRNGLEGRVE